MAFNTVTIGPSATQIVGANPQRIGLIIVNTSTTVPIYVGQDNTVTAANGIPILPQGNLTEQNGGGGTEMYYGPVFGIPSSGTVDVRYWERMH